MSRYVSHYQPQPAFNGVAAVLSFLLPGLGQVYRGSVLAGLLWLVVVLLGYAMLIVPGLVLHILCVVRAGQP